MRICIIALRSCLLRYQHCVNGQGDIQTLVEHFLNVYRNRLHTEMPELHSDTMRLLETYPWPGSIRELENVIHRALLVCDGKVCDLTKLIGVAEYKILPPDIAKALPSVEQLKVELSDEIVGYSNSSQSDTKLCMRVFLLKDAYNSKSN